MGTIDMIRAEPGSKGNADLVAQLITSAELRPRSVDDVPKLPPFIEKMKECARICGTAYSEVDHSIQNALTLRRLQQMVNTMMLNIHWAERLEGAGVRTAPRDFDEWQIVPISDK